MWRLPAADRPPVQGLLEGLDERATAQALAALHRLLVAHVGEPDRMLL
jgi:hypothetical protein